MQTINNVNVIFFDNTLSIPTRLQKCNTMSAKTLIDQGAEKAGSLRKLGELLGIPAGNLTQMKQGKRPCRAHVRARIAEIAGVDPTRAIIEGLRDELDESDEIQKGAQTMLQAMLDAFPNHS